MIITNTSQSRKPIHNGLRTQTHDHAITWHNFNTTKTIANTAPKLIFILLPLFPILFFFLHVFSFFLRLYCLTIQDTHRLLYQCTTNLNRATYCYSSTAYSSKSLSMSYFKHPMSSSKTFSSNNNVPIFSSESENNSTLVLLLRCWHTETWRILPL